MTDVGSQLFWVEEQTELPVLDVAATVGELRRCKESHGVGWAYGVELFFASVTVVLNEAVLEGPDEGIKVPFLIVNLTLVGQLGPYAKMQSPGELWP